MKFTTYILIIVLLLLSFLPLKSVFAAADNSFATTTLQSFVGVLIELGTPFGFNIADYIHPIYKKKDQIPTTKYKPFADFKTAFSTRLMPDYFPANGKIKDWTEPIIWSSLYCAVLKTSAPHGKPVEPIRALSSGAQESSEVPDAGRAFQQAVTINSLIGLYEKEPNADGVLDFDKPSRIVATISNGDCWRNDPNIEWDKIPNDQTKLSTFGGDAEIWSEMAETILITITEFINNKWTTITKCCKEEQAHNIVVLTEKKKTDHSQNNCHDSAHPCPAIDIGDETVGLDVSGGWSAGFTPYFITQLPVEPNAGLEYEIEVLGMEAGNITDSDKDFNIGADGQKKASCAVVPAKDKNADYQAIVKIGGEVDLECGPPVVKETCSSTTPPELPASSCKLCSPNMAGWAEAGTVPNNKLPDTFIKLIESVGDKMHVPPASILSAMYHEGAFVATQLSTDIYQGGPFIGADQWTEENVNKWLMCGAPIPNCSIEQNAFDVCHVGNESTPECTKAIVGTGTMPKWFWGNGGDSDPWNAVLEIDPSRTKETISPCNLVDSVAAMAKQLRNWGQTPRTPSTCYEKPMTSATAASSCSNSSWNDDKILQSHVGLWVGSTPWCPDGKTSSPLANNSPNPNYDDMVLGAYHAFSCNP